MFTAMLTAENIATGSRHDVWSVNVEEEYHEERSNDDQQRTGGPSTGPAGPLRTGTGRDAPVISRSHYPADHPVHKND